MQVHLDHLLVVDPRPRLSEPGDLGERQDPALLELRGLGRRFRPVVGQRQRDEDVGHGDEQADEEHPLQEVAEAEGEVDDQEDRSH